LLRPLLGVTKAQLVKYAIDHSLSWREDATNENTDYLRNYLRHNIVANMNQEQREAFAQHIELARGLNTQIDDLVAKTLERLKLEGDTMQQQFRRHDFVMLDEKIVFELLAAIIRQLGGDVQSAKGLRRLWLFIKTAHQNKQYQFGDGLIVQIQAQGKVSFSKSNL
jgi:tRNA(Ile)-lysidine synthase TilS/MesJ